MWWSTYGIPALGRLRQDGSKFEMRLDLKKQNITKKKKIEARATVQWLIIPAALPEDPGSALIWWLTVFCNCRSKRYRSLFGPNAHMWYTCKQNA